MLADRNHAPFICIPHFMCCSQCNTNFKPSDQLQSFLVVAPTEPAQLPGECPEAADLEAWIPYHGHCYYIEASAATSWAQASLKCTHLGERFLCQLM